MSAPSVSRIPPGIALKAGLTSRQVEALELWAADPKARSGGYGTIALALGISRSSAQGLIQRALRKLAGAMDEAA